MYRLNIIENIYYMIFLDLDNDKPKIVNLNTKNYILAKERAERYKKEYLKLGEELWKEKDY